MDNRIYLDNCSFNRPYDDQTILRNYLEAEAKTYIQLQIINNIFELARSYMMDYEIYFNPLDNRKNQQPRRKRTGYVVLIRYLTQGTYPRILPQGAGYVPFATNQIQKWKNIAKVNIQYSEGNILLAKDIRKQKIKIRDSIHIACAIEAECKYYITTDDKLLNKNIDKIIIIDPINFIKQLEA